MIEHKEIANHIREFLEAHHEKIIQFLKDLVALESPSREKEKQHIILDFLKEKFENIGYQVIKVPGNNTGGYLYARPVDRDRSLPLQLIIGHCDTVWPTDTIKTMPISYENGMIKGPGIYDMKAGLTQLYFSLMALKDIPVPLKVTPIILINSDEEIGSRESTNSIKRLAKISNRAYVLEPPLGLDGKLKTARKGLGRFTLTVTGKAAHAGLDPEKGINAIVELSHQVQQLYAMNDFEKGITVNVGMIEGGISPNVVAPESKAVVDVRVLNDADGKLITNKIMGLKPFLPNVQLTIEGGIGRPPMEKTPRNQELWKIAEQHGRELGIYLEQATSGGGSDANTTSIFTATLDGLGTPGDGAHAPHEYVFENKLIERTSLLTLLLLTEPLNR
ncbi:M20 family metallopeptidase [Arenibacter echinorum]|uniref:Glutamate carboxypeptidase n=1 Tax=Arenibacter echinorum TaxID=440515 RepID=A0A327RA75_9FLAO|nr:M20 family metallopeptidase [Arenibacter echinorum]RAJ12524.1 glutamate carboxypeptidase [Arenibacter echinorum]